MLLGLFVLLAMPGLLAAQVPYDLRRLPLPPTRSQHGFAIDPISGAAVVQGGQCGNGWSYSDETWLWQAGRWQVSTRSHWLSNVPPAGQGQSLLVDRPRRRLLLVGGFRYPNQVQPTQQERSVWQFQAGVWTQLSPGSSTAPEPVPSETTYAYDELRDRLVGVEYDASGSSRTWEWSTGSWTQRNPATAPPSRYGGAFAFLLARQHCVLFGGITLANTVLGDTWEWDGNGWQQTSGMAPAARAWAACTEDPSNARLLLVGGMTVAGLTRSFLTDVWEYGPAGWTQLVAPGAPARAGAACAFDAGSQRLLLMGGAEEYGGSSSDLWQWDGSQWRQLAPTAVPPAIGVVTDLVQNRLVAFDRRLQPWVRSGQGWAEMPMAGPAPPPRDLAAIAFDPVRGRTVVFGGYSWPQQQSWLFDTWEWDGSTWSQAQAATIPPLTNGKLACDLLGGGMLMFGDQTQTMTSPQTWRWDGSNWSQLFPPTSPGSAPNGLVMATDLVRGCVVLFDGTKTWEWDGQQWLLRSVAAPFLLHPTAMAFDPVRQVIALLGIRPRSGWPQAAWWTEIWEWNGTAWNQAWHGDQTPPPPVPRIEASGFAFDPAAGRLVIADTTSAANGTFEFGAVQLPTTYRRLAWPVTLPCVVPTGALNAGPLYLGEPTWISFTVPTSRPVPCFLIAGTSSTSWSGGSLPLSLTAFGVPCSQLLVSPDLVVYLGLSDGHTQTSPLLCLQPPMDPRYTGLVVNLQGLFLDPQANVAGLALTQGLALGIGMR